MRILMLVSYPKIRGPLPKITPLIVQSLRHQGCEVTTAYWGRHRDAEGWMDKIVGRAQDVAAVRRVLKQQQFDLMVVTTAHDRVAMLRDIPLLLATRGKRPPTVLQFHGSEPNTIQNGARPVFGFLSDFLVRMADGVMVLSSEERDLWQAVSPAGRFFVVTNPFVPYSEPLDNTRDRVPGGHTPVVLFVGRFIREKGIFDLLDAVAALPSDVAVRLVMAGGGIEEAELRRRTKKLGLDDRVDIVGYLEGERLQAAYRNADLFVLPTTWAEGFPTVLSEAMAAELPIVTTRMRGTADHLIEGVHSLFVPPHDPVALSAAIRRLVLDMDLRVAMGRANRRKVADFAPGTVGRHYLDVLRAVQANASAVCAVSAAG